MKLFRAFGILMVFVLLSVVHLAISNESINTSYEINDLISPSDSHITRTPFT